MNVSNNEIFIFFMAMVLLFVGYKLLLPRIRKTPWYARHFRKTYAMQEHMDLGKKPELLDEKEIRWGLRIGIILLVITAIAMILTYLYVPHQVTSKWWVGTVEYFASILATIPQVPLWVWILIFLFVYFPLTRLKPMFLLDNKLYFYYKITGSNSGITAVYPLRHPKRPFVFYNVNMRHFFGLYWIQSADLMVRWSSKPNIVVVESLAAGEVRHLTYLEAELRMSQEYNQTLEKELSVRTGLSLDVIKQLLAAARGLDFPGVPKQGI